MKVSIVIPAFNEVQTIAEVLRRIAAADVDAEIVVIDDGSTDGTRDVLQSRHGVTVIFHERNAGKGAAIRTGLGYVTGEVVIIQDADLEYSPAGLSGAPGAHPGRARRRRLRIAVPQRAPSGPLLLALGGQLPAHPAQQHAERPEPDRHGDRLQGLPHQRPEGHQLTVRSIRLRARDHRQDLASEVPHLRGCPSRTHGRDYAAGKKITWRDGVAALHHIVRFNLFPRQRPKPPVPHRVICRPDTIPHAHAGDID